MTRILVVTHKPLASLTNGHDLRVWHLCRELAQRHELYLLTVNLGSTDRSSAGLVGLSDVFKKMAEMPKFPEPWRNNRKKEKKSAAPYWEHAQLHSRDSEICRSAPEKGGSNMIAVFPNNECNQRYRIRPEMIGRIAKCDNPFKIEELIFSPKKR